MAFPPRPGGGRFNPRFQRQIEPEHRINEKIRVPQVRLVGDNVTVGIYPTDQALRIARDLELDLVKKRKEKEMKANAKQSEVKEIRFTPGTDDHDFDFKAKHAESFLKDGNKVKAYVQFKGRAIMFKERGELVLLKFAERLAEVGSPESLPKLEGKRMFLMLTPKTAKKKKETPPPSAGA